MESISRKRTRIRGSRVLITGASSGIGKWCAYEFASKGARLILTARRAPVLQELAREIKTAFPDSSNPLILPCDITNAKKVEKLIKQTLNQLGGIDILVNNAGIGVYGEIVGTSLADYRSLMDVNYLGSVNCILQVLPFMKSAGRGLIVNIASAAARYGVPYLAGYCASKAALVALSQSLRSELSRSGIRVMIVYPGYTQTDFFSSEKKAGGARRPAGPYMPVRKVAKSIVRGIELGKNDLTISTSGKCLNLFKHLAPWMVEMVMRKIAVNLRDTREV